MAPRKFLPAAAEVGVEGAGHDTRGARTAVSAGVGAAVAVPAGGVGHGPAFGKSKIFTIAPAVSMLQGPTVASSSGASTTVPRATGP